MRLAQAGHLLAQVMSTNVKGLVVGELPWLSSSGVDGGQRILVREVLVEARRAEILANVLLGLVNASAIPLCVPLEFSSSGPLATGHSGSQRLDAGHGGRPRNGSRRWMPLVRHQGHVAQPQILPESFIVGENKGLVLLDRPAQRTAELVALETAESCRSRKSSARRARCCAETHRRCREARSCPKP